MRVAPMATPCTNFFEAKALVNHSKLCLVMQVVPAAFLAVLLSVGSAGRTVESGGVEERDSLEGESRSGTGCGAGRILHRRLPDVRYRAV